MSIKSLVQALLRANPFAHRTHPKPAEPVRFVRRHIDGAPIPAQKREATGLDEPSIPSLPIG